MYDDLLGEHKKQVPTTIDVGICFQCEFIKESKIHRRSAHMYCREIKKYVARSQHSCLKFKRRQIDIV